MHLQKILEIEEWRMLSLNSRLCLACSGPEIILLFVRYGIIVFELLFAFNAVERPLGSATAQYHQ